MKRVFLIVLALIMCLTLCACGGSGTSLQSSGLDADTSGAKLDKDTAVKDKNDEKGDIIKSEPDDFEPDAEMMIGPDGTLRFLDTSPEGQQAETKPKWDPYTITVETGSVLGAKLCEEAVQVADQLYQFNTPVVEEAEYGYSIYETPIQIKESGLSRRYTPLGEFDAAEEFEAAWKEYAKGLVKSIQNNDILTDVEVYTTSSVSNDCIQGYSENNQHQYTLYATADGYQNVSYSFTMFVDAENESWENYDYSELVEILQHHTGIELTTGDIHAMQSIVAEHLTEDVEHWSVEVQSNEKDNYDSFRVAADTYTDGVQCWQFSAQRMVSKWADYYER